MPKYLTDIEIEQIKSEAHSNPEYRDDRILRFGKHHNSVLKVSQIHNLILIQGNENTGYQHIHRKHDYYQSKVHWKKGQLGTGSKFASSTIGFWDYLKIADKIYDVNNLVIEDKVNNDYELYKATLDVNGIEYTFRLLLYKGTKIIHNLFPEQDVTEWIRPDKFNFIRFVSEGTVDYKNSTKSFSILYQNKKKIVFKVSIVKKYALRKELIEITDVLKSITFFKDEAPLFSSFDVPCAFEIMVYQQMDLSKWELKILEYLANSLEF